jgi:hypothetical protein
MRIDLIPGHECMVSEIIGNLHESKTLAACETHLVLAKIRLNKTRPPSTHIRESSSPDELIADLETDLGDRITSYLTVRLTYKHSGFLDHKLSARATESSLCSQTTMLQSEATATIKRHNPHSVWSPRTSQTMVEPVNVNPLIRLIERHYSTDEAREAVHKLADDRVQIPPARRYGNRSQPTRSSEETVTKPAPSELTARIDSAINLSLLPPHPPPPPRINAPPGINAPPRINSPPEMRSTAEDSFPEMDPARKIWSEMRKNSRGHGHRSSISADHYTSLEDDCGPSRNSSDSAMLEERIRIQQTALKNKRSVGADSLRSIAPSLNPCTTSKGPTFGSLGLSMGRSFWGGNWW